MRIEVELKNVGRNDYSCKFTVSGTKGTINSQIYNRLKRHLMSQTISFDFTLDSKEWGPVIVGGFRKVGEIRGKEIKG